MNLNINKTGNKQRQIAIILAVTIPALLAVTMLPEIALAGKFDINAGIKAATDPLIKAIDDHWGKAVLITGCAAAVIGEGDARQRAVRAGISSTAAGGVVLALLAMLT
jgi:steroid 5-alpha reductase family enzyme